MIIFFDCRVWPKCVDDRHRGRINDDLDRDRDDGVDLLCCGPLLRLKEVYYSRTQYDTHIYTCTYKYYGMKTTVVELQIVPNYWASSVSPKGE